MIVYGQDDKEKTLYINCECGTHGIEIKKIKDLNNDYYISFYTDNFYTSQLNFLDRLKTKLYKIICILRNKSYKIDYEICLNDVDIENLMKNLQKLKEG